jgi:6-phosphogluconolactonase
MSAGGSEPAEQTRQQRVLLHRDAQVLAAAVAARLITVLVDSQSQGRVPSIVLTGGGVARTLHRAVRDFPGRDAVDWSHVEVWWGDERFVASDDPERNEAQARADLLDAVGVTPDRVHAMASSDGAFGDDLDAAARAYAEQLAAAGDGDTGPLFDVLMLGMGPDGHVASLFPEHAGLQEETPALAVRSSPKPPPLRISMSFPTLARSRQTWFLVSGEAKAGAVRQALSGAERTQIPAAGVRGQDQTLWLLDAAAASQLR